MVIAVNTESGIQDIRSLLVFLWPAGHSFADGIVVPAGGRRNGGPRAGCGRLQLRSRPDGWLGVRGKDAVRERAPGT